MPPGQQGSSCVIMVTSILERIAFTIIVLAIRLSVSILIVRLITRSTAESQFSAAPSTPTPPRPHTRGRERIGKEGEWWMLDKLLGAERLDVRYLIGSLEHSSVECENAPWGWTAELIEKDSCRVLLYLNPTC